MEAEKVDVEIVDIGREKKISKFFKKIKSILIKIKLGIAIILDGIDLLIGWIPIVNTLWDIVTFLILLIILKNKKLAFVSLIELPFFVLQPFSIFDMFILIATITFFIDNNIGNINVQKFKI